MAAETTGKDGRMSNDDIPFDKKFDLVPGRCCIRGQQHGESGKPRCNGCVAHVPSEGNSRPAEGNSAPGRFRGAGGAAAGRNDGKFGAELTAVLGMASSMTLEMPYG